MTKYVYDFSEGNRDMKDLLGGKGANLAEMTNMGLPVPPGFTITTEACLTFLAQGGAPPEMLEETEEHLRGLQDAMGKTLGDPDDPLLVSVRSGAKFSMPGMMDTVLNLGLNDRSVEGLAKQTDGDVRFARDAYRRFIQMFGKIVMDVPADAFEHALDEAKAAKGPNAQDTDLDADDLSALIERFRAIYREHTGEDFPQEPKDQLRLAIDAVFRSWNGKRAIDYRRQNKISDDLGTAVNIVAMVFGNRGEDSGTGVAFTRDPSTGEKIPYGDYLENAQGEDVVAGIRNTKRIAELERIDPDSYRGLMDVMATLEGHYQRHVRHRVHDREGQALDPADADRQADRVRRVGHGLRHARRGADRRRRGAAPRRCEPARGAVQASREGRRRPADREGPQREPRRRHRRGGVHGRRRSGACERRRQGGPGPARDHPGRLPRHDRLAGDPDERRRDELARGGRRARRGDPGGVRGRRDQARPRGQDVHRERHDRAGG